MSPRFLPIRLTTVKDAENCNKMGGALTSGFNRLNNFLIDLIINLGAEIIASYRLANVLEDAKLLLRVYRKDEITAQT
ncbi:hypothetical protein TRICHSKD4_1461 [Roseibium sp. TrichSKD4]|uniref:hypothetical protein n=1 Tax=Roseibium sp. TrichSKD4 TaxID=744980 RepID=UPI0001E5675E|nr:hypothetical protein [Roseibium sp. TrichSKD4]EFO32843.1 hypothetical protein TRICHSKD4_1461 [Roseibium sp. TrichSKD4]